MLQTLTGDTTDGYPGCKGIGPVNADKVLEGLGTPEEMWEAVVEAYRKKGFGREFALQQARCAFILRHGYWAPGTGVKLWEPATAGKVAA
jgi:DNA polymerase-1